MCFESNQELLAVSYTADIRPKMNILKPQK